MRADALTNKMRQFAENQGWTHLIRVSRRVGMPGVGSRLWRPWDLFDYLAFDAEGNLIGLRVHRVSATTINGKTVGTSDEPERQQLLARVDKRVNALGKHFRRDLKGHPWTKRHKYGLVVWTKTRPGNNGTLWWEARTYGAL